VPFFPRSGGENHIGPRHKRIGRTRPRTREDRRQRPGMLPAANGQGFGVGGPVFPDADMLGLMGRLLGVPNDDDLIGRHRSTPQIDRSAGSLGWGARPVNSMARLVRRTTM
jgi:hypothetical protein